MVIFRSYVNVYQRVRENLKRKPPSFLGNQPIDRRVCVVPQAGFGQGDAPATSLTRHEMWIPL